MGEPWYRSAFGHAYLALYRHRDLAEARLLVSSLVARGHVAPPALDLGCGAGRHLLALSETGTECIGIDLSEPLLLRARASLIEANLPVRLVRADIRDLPIATGVCGTALSLFTTFGYFDDVADESSVLAEACRVLRPGGCYVLDFLNAVRVRSGDGGVTTRREGDFQIDEARSLTPDGRRVVKQVRVAGVESGRELARYEERVTLFGREELTRLIGEAGLVPVELLGDYRGEPFNPQSSPRLIIVARKP